MFVKETRNVHIWTDILMGSLFYEVFRSSCSTARCFRAHLQYTRISLSFQRTLVSLGGGSMTPAQFKRGGSCYTLSATTSLCSKVVTPCCPLYCGHIVAVVWGLRRGWTTVQLQVSEYKGLWEEKEDRLATPYHRASQYYGICLEKSKAMSNIHSWPIQPPMVCLNKSWILAFHKF